MRHSAHGQSPFSLWHDRPPRQKRIFAFGQLGNVPVHRLKKKLQTRTQAVRYMYGINEDNICVLALSNGRYQHIRAIDFHPYEHATDPSRGTTLAFRTATINPPLHATHPPHEPEVIRTSMALPRRRRMGNSPQSRTGHPQREQYL